MIALEDDAGTKYRKLVISGGRIIGAILLGYQADVAPVRAAITARHRRRPAPGRSCAPGGWGVLAGE